MIALIIFRRKQILTEDQIDQDTIVASDYALMVSGLPKNEKEEDIKRFFENIIPGRKLDIIKVNMA